MRIGLIFSTLTVVATLILYSAVNAKANFRINDKYKHVIFGHSHPACAFNDSLISNFKNLAKTGESYFYTYQKVKKIVTQNPQIETVFIEFTTNNFNKAKDDEIWNEEYMNLQYPKYAPFMNFNDHLILMSKNSLSFFNSSSLSIKKQITKIITGQNNNNDLMGGYKYLVRDKMDSLLKAVDKPIILNKMDSTNLSYYNLLYLEKIINFCYENNKKVYLLRSPYHEKYGGNRFEHKLQKIKELKFPETDFLDFKDFPINNSEFGDLNHLNYKGAQVFSMWFDKFIKNGLLEKNVEKPFNNEMLKKEFPTERIQNN